MKMFCFVGAFLALSLTALGGPSVNRTPSGYLDSYIQDIGKHLSQSSQQSENLRLQPIEQSYREASAIFFQLQNGWATEGYTLPKMSIRGMSGQAGKVYAMELINDISADGKTTFTDLLLIRSSGFPMVLINPPVYEDYDLLERFGSFKGLGPSEQIRLANSLLAALREIEEQVYPKTAKADLGASIPFGQARLRLLAHDIIDFNRYVSNKLSSLPRSESSATYAASGSFRGLRQSPLEVSNPRQVPEVKPPAPPSRELLSKLSELRQTYERLLEIESATRPSQGVVLETVSDRNLRLVKIIELLKAVERGQQLSPLDLRSLNTLLKQNAAYVGGASVSKDFFEDALVTNEPSAKSTLELLQAEIKALTKELRRRSLDEEDLRVVSAAQKTIQFKIKHEAGGFNFRISPPFFLYTWLGKLDDALGSLGNRFAQKTEAIGKGVDQLSKRWAREREYSKIRRGSEREWKEQQRAEKRRLASYRDYSKDYGSGSRRSDPHARSYENVAIALFHLATISPLVIIGGGVTSIVAYSTLSDEAYLDAANRWNDEPAVHVENMVQMLEGRGYFGTPTPYNQAQALDILVKDYANGYYRTHKKALGWQEANRILKAVEEGKLTLKTEGYSFSSALKLAELLKAIKNNNPDNRLLIDGATYDLLFSETVPAPAKAILLYSLDEERLERLSPSRIADFYFDAYISESEPSTNANSLVLAQETLGQKEYETALLSKMQNDGSFCARLLLSDERIKAAHESIRWSGDSLREFESIVHERGKSIPR